MDNKLKKKKVAKKTRYSFPTLGKSVLASSLKEAEIMVGVREGKKTRAKSSDK